MRKSQHLSVAANGSITKRWFRPAAVAAICALACITGESTARGHQTDTRPIKLVVGFGAGGAIDTLARTLSAPLSKQLQRPVFVESRPGAGGSIAANYVKRSKPDGTTLLIASPAELFNASMSRQTQSPADDDQLIPVAKISHSPLVMVARWDSPIQHIADIANVASSRHGPVSFASSGISSSQHLTGELFKQASRVDLLHVPFAGSPTAISSLLANQVDLLIAGVTPIAPYLQNKQMRALAVASHQRSELLPRVPTMKELGYTNVSLEYWQGAFMPAKTSPELVKFFSNALAQVVQSPDIKHQLESLGYTLAFDDNDSFAHLQSEEKQLYTLIQTNKEIAPPPTGNRYFGQR